MLNDRIQQDLVIALKAHDAKTVSVVRFLQSAIKNKEIEKKQALPDDEILQIIRKQLKELAEAKVLFEKGERADLANDNEVQMKILQAYLPAEISDEELEREVKRLIEQNKELYEKNPKALIGICIAVLKAKASPQRIMSALQTYTS